MKNQFVCCDPDDLSRFVWTSGKSERFGMGPFLLRLKFLTKPSVLSVPIPYGEAFGAYIIEALAAGVPVV